MSIIPKDKMDLEACKKLEIASDSEIINNLEELLTWLQDINWPVANPIAQRISKLGNNLVKPVTNILQGNDNVWKYFIISGLLTKTDPDVLQQLSSVLVKIVDHPTPEEKAEEVNLVAKELLNENKIV